MIEMMIALIVVGMITVSAVTGGNTESGLAVKSLCRFDGVTNICWIDKESSQSTVPSEMDGYFCQNEADFMKTVHKLKSCQYPK